MNETMTEILKYLGTTLIGGGATWWFAKMKTRRERKATDLELIENAIAPLIKSINDLTTHAGEVTTRLVAEQEKNLRLLRENAALVGEKLDLVSKVESLERRVTQLTNEVKKLANEKSSTHTAD